MDRYFGADCTNDYSGQFQNAIRSNLNKCKLVCINGYIDRRMAESCAV